MKAQYWHRQSLVTKAHGIGLLVAMLMLITHSVVAKPPTKNKPKVKDPLRNLSPVPDPNTLQAMQNTYVVSVFKSGGVIKTRSEEQEKTAKEAASVVTRNKPIPNDRVRFFSWIEREDSPVTFAGWTQGIAEVKDTPEGRLIVLWASPLVQSRVDSGPASVMNMFVEEYLWANGNVRYLRGKAHPADGETPKLSRF